MKVYGDNDYGAYLILHNKKNNLKAKHYISAVDPSFSNKNKVKIWVRSNGSDICFDYELGKSKKTDIAVRTWVRNREKAGMYVSSLLPDSVYRYRK